MLKLTQFQIQQMKEQWLLTIRIIGTHTTGRHEVEMSRQAILMLAIMSMWLFYPQQQAVQMLRINNTHSNSVKT